MSSSHQRHPSDVAPATATTSASTTTATTTATRPGRARVLVGTGIGNALEWYDWNVYAVFAPFFAAQFFRSDDPTAALLSTLAVFAVGFFMRPLGGLLFGWVADRKGRRFALTTSIGCAAVGSLVIGLSPTYGSVGVVAPTVLLLARLLQGLAHGGELPSSQTYISEMAPAARRGRWASLIYVSGTAGVLAGTLLGALLASALSEQQLAAWGWRVPFVVGGVVGLYALHMRRQLSETEAFTKESAAEAAGQARPPLLRGIWEHRGAAVRVIGLTVGATVVYYTWAVAAPAYAISVKGLDADAALWAGVLANLVFIGVLPLAGILSDRIGRRPNLLMFGAGLALLTFPLNRMIGGAAWQLGVAMAVALCFIALFSSIAPAVYAEMFPTHIRTAGVGFPYSVAVATFGGTAPYLQTWFAERGTEDLFLVYSIVLVLVGASFAWRMPETRGSRLD